jgi:phosphoadenosine phosphosulfate reductase
MEYAVIERAKQIKTEVLSLWTPEELHDLNEQFRQQPPDALLRWAVEVFGQKVVLTCSFGGPSGMVLLDMLARIDRATPIVFLDTDLLFEETYALVDEVSRRYGIHITHQRPELTLQEQARQEGPELYKHNPDRCCGIRKVRPLSEALQPYAAWITGVRRDQSASRANAEPLQWSDRYQLLKLCPLAHWSERQVWDYIARHDVPYNPLLNQGYPSLGCTPCTRPASSDDPRSGRWATSAKTECGIHL